MARGEMLPIQHAARALGVPDDQIRRLAEQSAIPEAVDRDGEWLIPTMALASIARQQGWTLDLAALQQQLDEQSLTRYSGDALAAQAAVLLAKTQATAARVESRDLLRRLREVTTTASADRAARLEVAQALAVSQQDLEEQRRKAAVAEARLTELRDRVSGDDQQFQFMADRIKSLEQERRRLTHSLGWLGRLRYRRLHERDLSRPSPAASSPSTVHPGEGSGPGPAGGDVVTAPGAAEHRGPPEPIEAPDTELPVWKVAAGPGLEPEPATPAYDERVDHTVAHVRHHRDTAVPAVPIQSAATIGDASNHTTVPRAPDGRFDQSALTTMRSATKHPVR